MIEAASDLRIILQLDCRRAAFRVFLGVQVFDFDLRFCFCGFLCGSHGVFWFKVGDPALHYHETCRALSGRVSASRRRRLNHGRRAPQRAAQQWLVIRISYFRLIRADHLAAGAHHLPRQSETASFRVRCGLGERPAADSFRSGRQRQIKKRDHGGPALSGVSGRAAGGIGVAAVLWRVPEDSTPVELGRSVVVHPG